MSELWSGRVPFVLILAASAALACDAPGGGAVDAEAGALVSPRPVSAAVAKDLATFASTIPDAEERELDLEMALTLVAMPLSCLDRPHAPPPGPEHVPRHARRIAPARL